MRATASATPTTRAGNTWRSNAGPASTSACSVAYRWSAQDWSAADGVPYIGRMAGHADGVYLATAFKNWGMTHGTVAGILISDLIARRDNP